MRYILLYTLLALVSMHLFGCASAPLKPPAPPQNIPGIYHKVKKGQTLWRICKTYGIELDKVSKLNRLADTSRIYVGQLIFIPEIEKPKEEIILTTDFKDKGGDFIWPVKGKVGSFFGMKKDGVKNKGISIQATLNQTIMAARSGKVAFCSDALKGYGKTIIIDHLDGYSTVYAHNSNHLVRLNQLVAQGQIIAKVGSSGRALKPELYFEIRKGYKPQNPFFYLP